MRRIDSWLVFLACLAPRAAALAWFPPDTGILDYWEASDSLRATGTLQLGGAIATSLEPLYPLLLTALRAATGDSVRLVMLAQAVLGAFGGVLLYRLAIDLSDRRAAAAAAGLFALDPYLVRQAVSPVEITLAVTLLIAAVRSCARGDSPLRAAGTGALLGLATLTRASLLPVALAAAVILAWRRQSRAATVLLAVALIPAAAWVARSYAVNGAVVPTRVGINLFVSTNEYAGPIVPARNSDLLVLWAYRSVAPDVDQSLPEPVRQRLEDDLLLRKALDFARERPLETLTLKLRNLSFTVAPVLLPVDRMPRTATVAIHDGRIDVSGLESRPLAEHALYSASRTLLLIGTCAGLWRRRGRWTPADALMLAIAGSVIGISTIFFPTSRLLAPMAFVMMFYTGIALNRRGVNAEC